MPTVSFTPNVGASSVYTSVTGTITSVLAKANEVYIDAKKNLDLIKAEVDKGHTVTPVTTAGSVASAIGINSDAYSQSGFLTQLQAQTINVSIDETIAPPDKLVLSEITNNIEFDDTRDDIDPTVTEPTAAVSTFLSADTTLKSLRPAAHALTTVVDNMVFDKSIDDAGRSIVEPAAAVSSFTTAITDAKTKRPGTHTLSIINTDVTIDSVTKPDITFVTPKEPTLPPITEMPFPSFSFNYNESFYSSVLGSYLYTMILNELQNGSTGLTMSVENDIYSRESERDSLELQNTKDKISNMWAESGMSLPDGVLVSALAAVEIDFQNKYSDKSRDVRIESFKRADDNAKFIKDLALKYEQVLMDYMGRYWDRQLDASKSLLLYMQQLYDAIYKYYAIYNERYKAEVEGYKATVEGQTAELEAKARVYDSEIRYVSSKADVELREILSEIEIQKNDLAHRQNTLSLFQSDLKMVELYIGNLQAESANYGTIYSNRIADLDTKIKAFISEIQYEVEKVNAEYKKTSVDLDTQKNEIAERQNVISLYNSDISHAGLYIENLKAESSNYSAIYNGRIAAIELKIKTFMANIQYEIEKVNAEAKRVGLESEIHKDQIAVKQQEIEIFKNDLGYEVAKADVAVKKYSIEFDQYKTQAAIHQANVQFSDVDSRYHLGKLQALLESTKQEIDMMKLSVDATIAATSNIAQISSTMVAGALSALNANASMSTGESQGYSYGDSHSYEELSQPHTSINHNYNHDA